MDLQSFGLQAMRETLKEDVIPPFIEKLRSNRWDLQLLEMRLNLLFEQVFQRAYALGERSSALRMTLMVADMQRALYDMQCAPWENKQRTSHE